MKAKTLLKIIKDNIESNSTVYTDRFKSYDSLVFNGYNHYRIKYDKEFAQGKTHINSIERFWSFCKRRKNRFNGLQKKDFYLHLKECEFRLNYRKEDIYKKYINIINKI